LLINTDLRKPTSYFTNEETLGAGLSSWYQESISISEIIQRSPYENLDYIPSGPIPSDPFSLLTQGKTKTLIEKLKILYECIILDTSPLGIVSDTFLLTDYADILILIVRYNYTHINVFSQTIKELKQRRIKRVGIVMNDNRINGDQYGYGYKYGYGYNHQNKRFDLLENFKTIGDRFMKTIFRGNHKSVKNDPQTEAFPGVADR
jgi:capsular exopolysaccharide synthesis family protein